MRVADQPDYKMDWTEFAGQDRTKLQMDKHARPEVPVHCARCVCARACVRVCVRAYVCASVRVCERACVWMTVHFCLCPYWRRHDTGW